MWTYRIIHVSWSTASPTVWKIHNWQKYHLKREDLLFLSSFSSRFEGERRSRANTFVALGTWPTMISYQASKSSLTTSGAAWKALFSARDNCSCWILKQFESTSYFLGIQAWALRQNAKQKKYAQKSGQRSTFPILVFLFFIISQNACLNLFKTAFELLLYRKCGKKS